MRTTFDLPRIALVAGSIVGQVYHCAKCDYVGSLIFETELADVESGDPAA